MRRLVAGSVVLSFIVLSSITVVGGQSDPVTPPTEVRTTPGILTNMIGEVDVPWEILEYVQMKYEGHAVTKADKIRRGTSELYRLRVDRDDQLTDYESIAVLFDMNWKLVGEEKYASPPPKAEPKPQEQSVDETDEKREERGGQEEKPDPKEENPVEDDEEPEERDEPIEEEPVDDTPSTSR